MLSVLLFILPFLQGAIVGSFGPRYKLSVEYKDGSLYRHTDRQVVSSTFIVLTHSLISIRSTQYPRKDAHFFEDPIDSRKATIPSSMSVSTCLAP